MAIRVSQQFKDISGSFKVNPINRDAIAIKNETAISRSVRNLIFTLVDEVPYSDLGSSVNSLLFQNMNSFTADLLKDEILNVLKYEPRIQTTEVTVYPNYDENTFNVRIVYRIIGIDVPVQELSLALVSAR